ncbi:MAG: hypothetical protein AAGD22_08430 [Verrucomicrobiota bacterium]
MTLTKSLLHICLTGLVSAAAPAAEAETDTLNVLFIGNSYTGRHNLSEIVKEMAEGGNPGLTLNPTTVIYGGRTLADHWRLGTQNIVNIANLTKTDEEATIASLKETIANNPEDSHAAKALSRHEELLANLESQRTNWDVVVLQSYRDDLEGDPTRYAQFAPKFAELAQAQGARVILYETTPTTQNLEALTTPPDPASVHEKAKAIAALADQINAHAAPMSLVALRCQTERPDLTLRFINDAHLNHTMAYLTACTLYAALFNESPQGNSVDSVTDIRFLDNDPKNKDKDRDGNPITRTFNNKDLADLQRIAWQGYSEFQSLRDEE